MSVEIKHFPQTAAQTAEPRASAAPVPIWLFVVLFALLYWAMVYFDRDSGWFSPQVYAPYRSVADLQAYQPPTGGTDLARGKVVYENICALCHNPDGNGKPNQAPPLAFPQKVRRRVRQHRRHNAFRTRHQNRHSHREPDPG